MDEWEEISNLFLPLKLIFGFSLIFKKGSNKHHKCKNSLWNVKGPQILSDKIIYVSLTTTKSWTNCARRPFAKEGTSILSYCSYLISISNSSSKKLAFGESVSHASVTSDAEAWCNWLAATNGSCLGSSWTSGR